MKSPQGGLDCRSRRRRLPTAPRNTDSLNPYSVAPWVIGAGATDNLGHLADFSSRGDFGSPLFHPTIVAPGVNTVSLRASTITAVTTVEGLAANDAGLSPAELPYY